MALVLGITAVVVCCAFCAYGIAKLVQRRQHALQSRR
jgi:hypothetical protein